MIDPNDYEGDEDDDSAEEYEGFIASEPDPGQGLN